MPQIQLLLVRTDQNRSKDMTAVYFHCHPLLFFLCMPFSPLSQRQTATLAHLWLRFVLVVVLYFQKCILLNTGNTKCIFYFDSSVLVLPSKRLEQHFSNHSDLVSLGAPHFRCIHVVHSGTGKCFFLFNLLNQGWEN